ASATSVCHPYQRISAGAGGVAAIGGVSGGCSGMSSGVCAAAALARSASAPIVAMHAALANLTHGGGAIGVPPHTARGIRARMSNLEHLAVILRGSWRTSTAPLSPGG